MSPPSHISSSLLLLTTGLQVNTLTKPSESYSTTGQHVPTSPYLLFSTTTHYRSTCQHVVKTFKTIPSLQVSMSLPHHISYSLLRPTTGQHVVKTLRIILYCRSTCLHLATSLILYYHQQEVYMSTHCQIFRTIPLPQVTMSPPRNTLRYGPPIFYRSTRRLNNQIKKKQLPQVNMLPHCQIYFFIHFTTTLDKHVIKTKNHTSTTS